ncbi:MAG: enoyl-CoA hydratase [Minwuiales bacterium]|nr:enoyl-CoA hydratase [Minwuiales bacterium]
MAFEEILYDVEDGIATITLNRPDKLNAWTRVMEREVRMALEEASGDDAVRVIVLTGAGRGYCAGADMSSLNRTALKGTEGRNAEIKHIPVGPVAGGLDLPKDFHRRNTYYPTVPKPIIAAINGPCAGIGLVLTLYADMRFASDAAMFTTAFSRRGLVAEHGISWMLPQLVGAANALDLLLSARKVSAEEAQQMGLVNKVFPAATFMNDVRAYAIELATLVSPRSMRVMKQQVFAAMLQDLDTAVDVGDHEMTLSFDSEDFKEGVDHFVEKRAPAFTGR